MLNELADKIAAKINENNAKARDSWDQGYNSALYSQTSVSGPNAIQAAIRAALRAALEERSK